MINRKRLYWFTPHLLLIQFHWSYFDKQHFAFYECQIHQISIHRLIFNSNICIKQINLHNGKPWCPWTPITGQMISWCLQQVWQLKGIAQNMQPLVSSHCPALLQLFTVTDIWKLIPEHLSIKLRLLMMSHIF